MGRAKQHRRANKRRKTAIESNPKLVAFRNEMIKEFIRDNMFKPAITSDEPGYRAWIDWARDVIKREKEKDPLAEWGSDIVRRDINEALAADRQRNVSRWPANDYVLNVALTLIGAIVLIALAVATGLVKP